MANRVERPGRKARGAKGGMTYASQLPKVILFLYPNFEGFCEFLHSLSFYLPIIIVI